MSNAKKTKLKVQHVQELEAGKDQGAITRRRAKSASVNVGYGRLRKLKSILKNSEESRKEQSKEPGQPGTMKPPGQKTPTVTTPWENENDERYDTSLDSDHSIIEGEVARGKSSVRKKVRFTAFNPVFMVPGRDEEEERKPRKSGSDNSKEIVTSSGASGAQWTMRLRSGGRKRK